MITGNLSRLHALHMLNQKDQISRAATLKDAANIYRRHINCVALQFRKVGVKIARHPLQRIRAIFPAVEVERDRVDPCEEEPFVAQLPYPLPSFHPGRLSYLRTSGLGSSLATSRIEWYGHTLWHMPARIRLWSG